MLNQRWLSFHRLILQFLRTRYRTQHKPEHHLRMVELWSESVLLQHHTKQYYTDIISSGILTAKTGKLGPHVYHESTFTIQVLLSLGNQSTVIRTYSLNKIKSFVTFYEISRHCFQMQVCLCLAFQRLLPLHFKEKQKKKTL